MRNSNDLYVGELYQDLNEGGDLIERYYVELGHTDIEVFLDRRELDNLGVPRGLVVPSWCGWMGCVYTHPITGDNYFIAE